MTCHLLSAQHMFCSHGSARGAGRQSGRRQALKALMHQIYSQCNAVHSQQPAIGWQEGGCYCV